MIDYLIEIRLSRELATTIKNELEKNPNSLPKSIVDAYNKLCEQYVNEIEMGVT